MGDRSSELASGEGVRTVSAAWIASASDAWMSWTSVRSMRLDRRFSSTHALVPVSTTSMSVIMIVRSFAVSDHSSQITRRRRLVCLVT